MLRWRWAVLMVLCLSACGASAWAGSPPVANFSFVETSFAPEGATYAFTDLSTNSPTSWSWSFGDVSYSTAQNPSHTYAAATIYSVYLTVTNANGSNTWGQGNCIKVPALMADFTATPTSGPGPLSVAFTDASVGLASDPQSTPNTWLWSFGDGGISTEQNPTHTYTFAGNHTVWLRAQHVLSDQTVHASAEVTKSDFVVVAAPDHALTVAAAASQFVVGPAGCVNLTASAVDSEGHTMASWSWSDGGRGGRILRPHGPEPDLHRASLEFVSLPGHSVDRHGDRPGFQPAHRVGGDAVDHGPTLCSVCFGAAGGVGR